MTAIIAITNQKITKKMTQGTPVSIRVWEYLNNGVPPTCRLSVAQNSHSGVCGSRDLLNYIDISASWCASGRQIVMFETELFDVMMCDRWRQMKSNEVRWKISIWDGQSSVWRTRWKSSQGTAYVWYIIIVHPIDKLDVRSGILISCHQFLLFPFISAAMDLLRSPW